MSATSREEIISGLREAIAGERPAHVWRDRKFPGAVLAFSFNEDVDAFYATHNDLVENHGAGVFYDGTFSKEQAEQQLTTMLNAKVGE